MLLENAEIANMAVWLASDQSTYGTTITDGGIMQGSVGL